MRFNTWFYQLQNVEPDTVAAIKADLKVIDPTRDGLHYWKSADINKMRGEGETVVAYLSIGEAENYRQYWDASWKPGSPQWLGPENPEWKGNYKVRYWNMDWQRTVLFQLDTILSQGFDGVYLDIIDAYEYWRDQGVDDAADRMVDFVSDISDRGKRIRKDFLIIPQNGAGLLTFDRYVAKIDAIAREDMLYGENHDGVQNDRRIQIKNLDELEPMHKAKKDVLAVEYGLFDTQQNRARIVLGNEGIVPYFTTRDLDEPTEPQA